MMEDNNNIKKIDSVKLAKDRGFDVQLSKLLEKNIRGCILINKEKKEKIIVIDDFQTLEYKRFVLAYFISLYDLYLKKEKIYGKTISDIDFYQEENEEIVEYAINLLTENKLITTYLKNEVLTNDCELCYLLMRKYKIPEFALRQKIKKYRSDK